MTKKASLQESVIKLSQEISVLDGLVTRLMIKHGRGLIVENLEKKLHEAESLLMCVNYELGMLNE